MKRKILAGAWLAVLILAASTGEASEPAAGAAGAFLKLGADARALGLGSAYTAVAGDAAAAFWNPAGLSLAERSEFRGTYTSLPDSGDYSQLSFLLPLSVFGYPPDERAGSLGPNSWGAVAIYLIRLAAAYNIEARQNDSLSPDYLFSDIEGCYGLAWGLPLGAAWSVGMNVKGLFQSLDQTEAGGWGLDVGALWQGIDGLRAGLSVRDLYTRLDWQTGTHDIFPATASLGAAYDWTLNDVQVLLVCASVEKNTTQRPVRLHAGLEYGWNQMLFARAGFFDGQWTAGAGIRLSSIGWARAGLQLDYALAPDRIEGWDHWVTLGVKF